MVNSNLYRNIISKKANLEISKSWDWYEERQRGLGDRFFKELIQQLKQIEQFPERYPCKYKSYRETSLNIFPFSIIYKVNKRKNIIVIVSVFHNNRNPSKRYKE